VRHLDDNTPPNAAYKRHTDPYGRLPPPHLEDQRGGPASHGGHATQRFRVYVESSRSIPALPLVQFQLEATPRFRCLPTAQQGSPDAVYRVAAPSHLPPGMACASWLTPTCERGQVEATGNCLKSGITSSFSSSPNPSPSSGRTGGTSSLGSASAMRPPTARGGFIAKPCLAIHVSLPGWQRRLEQTARQLQMIGISVRCAATGAKVEVGDEQRAGATRRCARAVMQISRSMSGGGVGGMMSARLEPHPGCPTYAIRCRAEVADVVARMAGVVCTSRSRPAPTCARHAGTTR